MIWVREAIRVLPAAGTGPVALIVCEDITSRKQAEAAALERVRDVNDLRQFTTPELFAELRLDLQDRADAKQTTDVVRVDASLVDFAEESGRQVVSVRYSGLVREESEAAATPMSGEPAEPAPVDSTPSSRPTAAAARRRGACSRSGARRARGRARAR